MRGITVHIQKGQIYGGGAYYERTEPMSVRARGPIWVVAEDGLFDRTQPIHYRFAAQGDKTELGAITTTADAGTAPLPTATFLQLDGTDLAEINLNLL